MVKKNSAELLKQGVVQTKPRKFLFLGVACVGALILFGLALWQHESNDNKVPENKSASNINSTIGQTNSNSALAQMTNEQREQAYNRDTVRISDIRRIQDALEEYKKAVGSYPQDVSLLKPKYLGDIPQNPTPGGEDYVYTLIGTAPSNFYDLSYSLEVGTNGIGAGNHIASPDGVATP